MRPTTENATLLRAEREAGRAARHALGPWASRQPVQHMGLASTGARAPISSSPGRPLAPAQRERFESGMGHDFRNVRLHSSGEAARSAADAGARAYTSGDNIVFGEGEYRPGTPAGDELLAHELAHVAQQEGQAPIMQKKPPGKDAEKEDAKNPGDFPPAEKFAVASAKATEDLSFLFSLNKTGLPPGVAKKLSALLARHSGSLQIEIHGYASKEGTDEYNVNLAAHRAAAVKSAILPLLPADAEVELYSHGETDAFGPAARNRRAGIAIKERPPAKQIHIDDRAPAAPNFAFGYKPNLDLGLGLQFKPLPRIPLGPVPLPIFQPAPEPASGPDWYDLTQPFRSRGILLNERDFRAIEDNWHSSYLFFLALGLSPKLAAKGATAGNSVAYDFQMANEAPTVFDKSNKAADLNKQLKGGWATPVVPFLSPTTIKILTGGKLDLRF